MCDLSECTSLCLRWLAKSYKVIIKKNIVVFFPQEKLKDFEVRLNEERKNRMKERKEKRKEERRQKWLAEKEEAEQRKRDEEMKRRTYTHHHLFYYITRLWVVSELVVLVLNTTLGIYIFLVFELANCKSVFALLVFGNFW